MMNGLEGMGWGMGLLGLLVLVLVVLGIVALAFFVTGLFASTLHSCRSGCCWAAAAC